MQVTFLQRFGPHRKEFSKGAQNPNSGSAGHTLTPPGAGGGGGFLGSEATRPSAEQASQGSSKDQKHRQLVARALWPGSREVAGTSLLDLGAWPKHGAVGGLQMS